MKLDIRIFYILSSIVLSANNFAYQKKRWHIWIEESRSAGTLNDRNSRAYKNNKLLEYIIENKLGQDAKYSVFRGWKGRISPSVVKPNLISKWDTDSFGAVDSIWKSFTPKASTDSMPLLTLGSDYYTIKRNNEISSYLEDDMFFKTLGIIAVSTWGSTSVYEKLLYKLAKKGVHIYTINIADQKYSRSRVQGKINYCQGHEMGLVVECFNKAFERSKGDPNLYKWDNSSKTCKNHLEQRGFNSLKEHQFYLSNQNMDCLNLSGMDFTSYPGNEYPIQSASLNGTIFQSSTIKDKTFNNNQTIQNATFIDNDIEDVTFNQNITNTQFTRNRFRNVVFANKISNSSFKELNDFNLVTFKNLSNNVFEDFTGENVTIDPSEAEGSNEESKNIFKGNGQILNNWIVTSDKKPNESQCRLSLNFENLTFNQLKIDNIDLCDFRLDNIQVNNSSIKDLTATETNFGNVIFNEVIPLDNITLRGKYSDKIENVQINNSKSNGLTFFGLAKANNLSFTGGEHLNLLIRGTEVKAAIEVNEVSFRNTLPSSMTFKYAIIDSLSMETIPYSANLDVVRFSNTKFANGYGPNRSLSLTSASSEDASLNSQGYESLTIKNSTLKNLNAEALKAKSFRVENSILEGANFKNLDVNNLKIHRAKLYGSDFRGAYNLSNQEITNSDFFEANLSNLIFHGTNFSGTSFNSATLKEASFDENTKFEGNSFNQANFYGATLSGVSFKKAEFNRVIDFSYPNEALNVTCNQCNFNNTELKGGFKGSKLTDTTFDYASISNAIFNGSLKNVSFRETIFNGMTTFGGEGKTIIENVNLNLATFEGTTIFQNIEGKQFNLSNAYVHQASFYNLDLNQVIFDGSILTDTLWRDSNFLNVSFNNSNLKNSNLSKISLKRGEIKKTDFKDANLSDISFEDIEILKILNFGTITGPLGPASGLTFTRTDFLEEDLEGFYLSNSIFTESSLARTNLKKAQMKFVTFDRGSFRGVNLKDSLLEQVTFKWVEFPAANFQGASLSSYKFMDSYLIGAKGMRQAKLYSNDSLSSFKGSNLGYLDLSGLNLSSTSFENTLLEYTLFNNTDLTSSNFSRANVYETEFYGAKTNNAKFNEVDPYGALGLAL